MSEQAEPNTEPKGPFWAWNDISGTGPKWHLCVLRAADEDTTMISYVEEDFEDFFYPEDFEPEEIVLIEWPAALEE